MSGQYLETTVDKFTFRVATGRSYSADGVWLEDLGGGRIRVGVTDFLQQHSGDVAFATVKQAGTTLAAGDDFAALETVKANVALPSPVSGTIVDVNPALEATPEVVNQSPYDEGWLAVIHAPAWNRERADLLEPPAYLSVMQAQARQEVEGT